MITWYSTSSCLTYFRKVPSASMWRKHFHSSDSMSIFKMSISLCGKKKRLVKVNRRLSQQLNLLWLIDCLRCLTAWTSDWLAAWQADCQTARLPDCHVARLAARMTDWLPDCQTARLPAVLTVRLTVRLPNSLRACLPDCLLYWLTDWLTDWPPSWLTACLTDFLTTCSSPERVLVPVWLPPVFLFSTCSCQARLQREDFWLLLD